MSGSGTGIAASGLKRRLALGFGMQGVAFMVTTLVQFLMVPVFLAVWGDAMYADWLLLFAAIGLLTLLDLGCQGHLANALRASWAVDDAARFQRVLQSGLFTYAAATAFWCGAVVVVAAAMDVPALLGLRNLPEAGPAFLVLALSMIVTIPRGFVAAIYSARGEFGRELGLGIALTLGQAVAQALTVLAGGTPLQAAAAYAAAGAVIGWGVLLRDVARRFPDVDLRPRPPTWEEVRLLVSRAPYYLLSLGANNALVQLPLLVLGRLAPEGAVVAFSTMRIFTGLVRQGAAQVATATGIEMARQHAQGDQEGLRRAQAGTARLTAGLTALFSGLSLVLGRPFFDLWTRGTVAFDPGLAAVFLGGVLVMTPVLGPVYLMRFIDRPRSVALGMCAQAAATVALCVALAPEAGAFGAVLAVAAAEVLTLGVQGLLVGRRMTGEAMFPHALRTYAVALLGMVLGGGTALGLERVIPAAGPAGIVAFTVAWAAIVAGPAFFLLLNAGQRTWVVSVVRRLGARAGGQS